MSIITVHQLRQGMSLAKPVFNLRDDLLLREGTIITERHLKLLRAWEVGEVEVVDGVRSSAASPANEEVVKMVQERLARRFTSGQKDEITMEIMRVARKHALQRALAKRSSEDDEMV